MPTVNHGTKELLLKIVYYGPGLGGKTTNLELIHARTRADLRGKLVSLNTGSERTLFFDLLPIELGAYRGYTIRLHLCTVPGQAALDQTRRLILKGVDGLVFVVDSQEAAHEENVSSLSNLVDNLTVHGRDPGSLPLVVQYNKQDLAHALSPSELQERLGIDPEVPQFRASAVTGQGVFETLREVVKACLLRVGDPARLVEARPVSIIPGQRVSLIPGARAPAPVVLPPPPRIPSIAELENEPSAPSTPGARLPD